MKSLPKIGEFMDAAVPTLSPEAQIMKAVDFLIRVAESLLPAKCHLNSA